MARKIGNPKIPRFANKNVLSRSSNSNISLKTFSISYLKVSIENCTFAEEKTRSNKNYFDDWAQNSESLKKILPLLVILDLLGSQTFLWWVFIGLISSIKVSIECLIFAEMFVLEICPISFFLGNLSSHSPLLNTGFHSSNIKFWIDNFWSRSRALYSKSVGFCALHRIFNDLKWPKDCFHYGHFSDVPTHISPTVDFISCFKLSIKSIPFLFFFSI